jgi:pyruvate/2-oxoglutarate dehydrogenase complex dihydrolipoamide dehydrogenase (E3) component
MKSPGAQPENFDFRKTGRILGFTAFGVRAGEIMGAVQVAMLAGFPYTELRETVFTHPTLLEGLVSLFSDVPQITRA